jgi:hypothetical protein
MSEELYGVAFDYNKNNFGSTEARRVFWPVRFPFPEFD